MKQGAFSVGDRVVSASERASSLKIKDAYFSELMSTKHTPP